MTCVCVWARTRMCLGDKLHLWHRSAATPVLAADTDGRVAEDEDEGDMMDAFSMSSG